MTLSFRWSLRLQTGEEPALLGSQTGLREETQAFDLLRVQQAALGLRAFIVIEEIGPLHLCDFMFHRKFWSPLIDDPPSRNQGHIRCEDSLCRSRGSQVVDHVDPDVRIETHRPDLSDKIPTSLLKEAVKACRIFRVSYRNAGPGLRRPEGLDLKRLAT
jgi:hypothetical protein